MPLPMWRLIPGLELRYRTWDNEDYVLYNNLSGDTHLLDAPAMEVLSSLQAGAAGMDGLCALLQLDDAASREALGEVLYQLEMLTLVETAC